MRRLILEIMVNEFSKLTGYQSLQKVKMMEVLTVLKYSDEEVALVCRMEFEDPASKYEEVFDAERGEAQLLEREKEGTYIYFIRSKPQSGPSGLDTLAIGYMTMPYGIREGKFTASFLGSAKQIKELLKMIDGTGITYKIVSLADAKFSPGSPLNRLTVKQRTVLTTAYKLGYYDVPRTTSSEELAEKLHIRAPTLVMHRRKAEKRLLSALLEES